MPNVELKDLSKSYGSVKAVVDASLQIENGEYVVILGPSGCGKTTLLNLIAGIVRPTRGSIRIDNRDVTNETVENRSLSFVFQNIALFPHMTLLENSGYSPFVKNEPNFNDIAESSLELVDLLDLKNEHPGNLPGGFQQKTSLARAISTNAKLMILDEPISALDPAVRLMLRFKLRDLIKKLGLTAIHVTHDQDIAMSVADKIILMKGGRIVRYGTPQQMYNEPEHIFEAFFVGEGNFLAGKITEQSDETITVQLKNKVLVIKKREQNTHLETGTEIILFSRPENTFLTPKRTDNSISGIIKTKTLMNGFYRYEVETSTEDIVLVDITLAKAPFSISEAVFVKFKSKTTILFKMPENGLEEEMKLE
jgi:ABC-type Fe3+/spermidine/putrescine transport system ATPase subunit